jgi:glycosyltransferase involved in cell wall biosynthesis
MPHVLHVINTTEIGGGAQHLVLLTRGLTARGVTSAIVTGIDGSRSAELAHQGVPVTSIGPMRLAAPGRLGGLLRRARPDLLHLHGSRAGLAGTIAAARTGVRPVVYTAHAPSFKRRLPPPLPRLAAMAESLICSRAARVIFLNGGDREEASRRGVGTANAVIVANGIDVEPFDPGEDRRAELRLEPSWPVVGMVARFVAGKDPITFVRMARRVADRVPQVRFLMVGDGPMRAAIEREVAALRLSDRVVLTGFRNDIPEVLATIDVVVFPSLWEALPLGLLEAMAARRAVVASRLPGHAEVIEEGISGLLAPAGDADAFAQRVSELCDQPERRRRLGAAARATIERRYGVERMVAETMGVYRSAGLAIGDPVATPARG